MANKNSKIISMTDEDRQKAEDERFMQGKATRAEVANYVNSLLEQHYMPMIERMINDNISAAKLGIMIVQALLVDKGICTGDEIEQFTKSFIEQRKAEVEQAMKEAAEKVADEASETETPADDTETNE